MHFPTQRNGSWRSRQPKLQLLSRRLWVMMPLASTSHFDFAVSPVTSLLDSNLESKQLFTEQPFLVIVWLYTHFSHSWFFFLFHAASLCRAVPALPSIQTLPGTRTFRPYTTYELELIRRQQKVYEALDNLSLLKKIISFLTHFSPPSLSPHSLLTEGKWFPSFLQPCEVLVVHTHSPGPTRKSESVPIAQGHTQVKHLSTVEL